MSFNYSVICTRRVVEQAFSHLKGCWRVTAQSKLSVVDTVYCGLDNICERYECYEDDVLPDPTSFEIGAEEGDPECLFGMGLCSLSSIGFNFGFCFLASCLVTQCSKQS